jgi:hypothetical protein
MWSAAVGFGIEYRPKMYGKIEVERAPHGGNHPHGLGTFADPDAISK